MCKCLVNVQMLSECANVRMCKCANGRFLLLISLIMCNFVCQNSICKAFAHLHILTFAH